MIHWNPATGALSGKRRMSSRRNMGATDRRAPTSTGYSRSCTAATAPCRGTTACSRTSWRSRRSGRRTSSSSRPRRETGVHDHLVADRLVRARGDGGVAQRLVDLAHVRVGLRLQRRLHHAPELHAREVRRRRRVRRDLVLEPADLLVLRLDLADDLVLVPVHLEAELDLPLHLLEHVAERLVRPFEELLDVVLGAEDRAERHRQHGEVLHHQLVHVLVREGVLARRIEHDQRTVRDDGAELLVVDGVDLVAAPADADRAEVLRRLGFDDAVDVLPLLRLSLRRLNLFVHGGHIGRAKLYNTSTLPALRLAHKTERWFVRTQRPLPWRRRYDPYEIWVSEVMAQQTRIEVVLAYYERFLARFPTLAALAAASDDDVTAAWSSLGYYRLARMRRDGARAVRERGSMPRSIDEPR